MEFFFNGSNKARVFEVFTDVRVFARTVQVSTQQQTRLHSQQTERFITLCVHITQ